jgi:3-deoxy-D-manno-octulosonic-acid transferase
MLPFFSHVFVQNTASASLLHSIGYTQTTVAGDTRVDRVMELAAQAPPNPVAAAFAEGKKWVVVGGSVWPPDEVLLAAQDQSTYALLLAPHEVDEATVQTTENTFKKAGWQTVRYSQADPETAGRFNVLIIDNVGMLNTLYRYGRAAYIGGGFGKGIHNTLEPAAWGLPVLFGPKYTKFEEACRFVETGGAFEITDAASLTTCLKMLSADETHRRASEAVLAYLQQNQGATGAILAWFEQTGTV